MTPHQRPLIVLASILVLVIPALSAKGGGGLRTVALSGDVAPGAGAGVAFDVFSFASAPPVLNNSGQVALTALLQGTGAASNDTGIWKETSNGLTLVAREGALAEGTNVNFGDLRGARFVLNSQGGVAFRGGLDTSQPGVNSTNSAGVWSDAAGGTLALVARGGDAAPGTTALFRADTFTAPALNSSGQIVFKNLLQGPGVNAGNSTGIWSAAGGGGVELVAREGNAAPSGSPGTTFGDVGSLAFAPQLNDQGQTVFHALVRPPGAVNDLGSDESLWKGGPAGLELIARAGDVAPGVAMDARFRFFSRNEGLALNDKGHTAFRAGLDLASPGVDLTNDAGIWSDRDGAGMSLTVREGDQAPGAPVGALFNFNTIPDDLVLNNQGHTAFLAVLQGAELGAGIWSERQGTGLQLVARVGAPASDVEAGVLFQSFFSGTLVLNNRGQTAFYGTLTGPGVIDSTNDAGIWAEDIAGNLRLIAREGNEIDVSDDPLNPDLRTISQLIPLAGSTGNGDGRPSAFNDLGQLVFAARFTDGSEGVFVSNLVAIPEPTSLVMVLALSIFAASQRALLSNRPRTRSGPV